MSDEDQDVDIHKESEEKKGGDHQYAKPRRDYAQEKKRRDLIKEGYDALRDSLPGDPDEKTPRQAILTKAAEYIVELQGKDVNYEKEIETCIETNRCLKKQIEHKEKEKYGDRDTGNLQQASLGGARPVSQRSEEDAGVGQPSRKKLKATEDSS